MQAVNGFVLDAVLEGVPSPRSAEAGAIWPRALVELWSPVELQRPVDGHDEARRAWRVRDPEGDLEITVIWAPGPGDPEEASFEEHAAKEGEDAPPEGWLLFGH